MVVVFVSFANPLTIVEGDVRKIIAIRTVDSVRFSLCCICGTYWLQRLPNLATYFTPLPWSMISRIIDGKVFVSVDGQPIDVSQYTWRVED